MVLASAPRTESTNSYVIPKHYVPGTSTMLLTNTSKMGCPSWSLPAGPACPFAVRGEGSICDSCYAQKGSYTLYPNVARAQWARFNWTREAMKTESGRETWITTMVDAIRASHTRYFRIHDAGDFFSPTYTRCWMDVARRLPEVRFWAPTRSYRGPWLPVIVEFATLSNVIIRPSALHFDAPAPVVPGLHAGTTATTTGFTCPASRQGNQCGACRVCWDNPTTEVSYHKH